MKKISELQKVDFTKALGLMLADDPVEWVEENISNVDCINGVYVFGADVPGTGYNLVFVGNYCDSVFANSIVLKEIDNVQLSDFKNGYFELIEPDNTTVLVVGNNNPLFYSANKKPYFDKVYNDPMQIKNIPESILFSRNNLEGFETIARWSFYEKENEFDNILNSLEKTHEKNIKEK